MTVLVCGRWTPEGPCSAVVQLGATCSRCDDDSVAGPDARRARRINAAQDARHAPPEHGGLPVHQCFQKRPDGTHCLRSSLSPRIESRISLGATANACGGLHVDDLPVPRPIRIPRPWRPLRRRSALAAAATEQERVALQRQSLADWPDPVHVIPSPRDHVPSPLAPASDAHEEAVTRLLGYTAWPRTGKFGHDETDRKPGYEACRLAWYEHSGRTAVSRAGALRHAVAELFPAAAALRPSDEPAAPDVHADMCSYLAASYREAQHHLAVLGVQSVTLHRGWHASCERAQLDRDQPFGRMVQDAIDDGTLTTTPDPTSRGFVTFDGSLLGKPIVSTLDGWSTHRHHAEQWSTWGSQLTIKAVMSAEVPATSILSWATLGLGDSGGSGHTRSAQEVLVLGSPGRVRWHVKGTVYAPSSAA